MRLFLIFLFAFISNIVFGCSCSFAGDFLTVAKTSELIIEARVIQKKENIITVKISNLYKGKTTSNIITIYGDKGGYSCLESFKYYNINDNFIFALHNTNNNNNLSNCGEYHLRVENNLVKGMINDDFLYYPNGGVWPGWNGFSMTKDDFEKELNYVLSTITVTPPCRPVVRYKNSKLVEKKFNNVLTRYNKGEKFDYFDFSDAIENNNLPLVKFFIDSCSLLQNEKLSNLVSTSCEYGFYDIAMLFFDSGVDVKIQTYGNMSLMEKSVYYPKLLKEIHKRGGEINRKGYFGLTPLMHAVRDGCLESIKYLLDNGADLSLKNNKGLTAYDYLKYNKKNKNDVLALLNKYK